MALADMRGHGADASRLSAALYKSLQRRMNSLNGGGVLEDLNEEVHQQGFSALTTAAVLSYYTSTRRMYFSYAGHPPVFIRDGETGWRPLVLKHESPRANLPLGVMRGTRYDQNEIELRRGDRLFLYTDGVLECPDASGDDFGEDRLLSVLRRTEKLSLSEAKEAVTRALRSHAGGDFAHDDCTFVIAEILGEEKPDDR
jgi:sigma-B regulation protein RsbU (phosphoserine phosphatase)